MSYHQQRQRHARVLLARWLRRWAVFIATGLLLLAAGADSAWQIAATALGGLVAPLLHAARQPAGLLPLAGLIGLVGIYALLATLPVLATRALWWPRRWAEAERALPLAPAELRASDHRVLRWLVLPVQGLLWAGMAVLVGEHGRAAPAALAWAACALVLSGLASALLGAAWMHHLRRQQGVLHGAGPARHWAVFMRPALKGSLQHRGQPPHASQPSSTHHTGLAALRRTPWPLALLWWPLWRGQASRTARGLVLAGTAMPALAAAPVAAPAATGWWLAALAMVALATTAWLRSRSEAELQARWPRLCHLPIAPGHWQAARRGLVLAPVLLAFTVGLLLTGPLLLAQGARPLVLLAFAAVWLGSAWLEARPAPADAGHHAARAVLSLVLCMALASEVMP